MWVLPRIQSFHSRSDGIIFDLVQMWGGYASLGCKAVFLLGGTSREESPTAMFVRSGDVVLMAGPARRCFHGILNFSVFMLLTGL
jgi:hypothetical protein